MKFGNYTKSTCKTKISLVTPKPFKNPQNIQNSLIVSCPRYFKPVQTSEVMCCC